MTKEQFFQICIQFLNVPYLWGGSSPLKGMDCSGFVQELLAIIGIDPPGDQTAEGLFLKYQKYPIGPSEQDIGMLTFYGGPTKISHVGMIIATDYMIEAGGGNSKTSTLMSAIDKDARVRIRPIHSRNDYVATLVPPGIPWIK